MAGDARNPRRRARPNGESPAQPRRKRSKVASDVVDPPEHLPVRGKRTLKTEASPVMVCYHGLLRMTVKLTNRYLLDPKPILYPPTLAQHSTHHHRLGQ